jgi:hypothetical protein
MAAHALGQGSIALSPSSTTCLAGNTELGLWSHHPGNKGWMGCSNHKREMRATSGRGLHNSNGESKLQYPVLQFGEQRALIIKLGGEQVSG